MRLSGSRGWVILFATVLLAVAVLVGIRSLGHVGVGRGISGTHASKASAKPLYHCPMHPTIQSDKPGNCSICGMRLVLAEKSEAEIQPAPAQGPPPAPRKRLLYRSTMNPSEVSDHPGKDSMGMEMVPVEMEEPGEGGVEGLAPIQIPSRRRQLIGVRTTIAKRSPLTRTLRTVGRVAIDESRLHHVHTKVEGWIEELRVNATGEPVVKGQPLLQIYSPELLATQEEFLLALKARQSLPKGAPPASKSRMEELVESSRRRLLLFDLTPGQIEKLEKTGVPTRTVILYSPLSGIVLERKVTHGERIDPSMALLEVADLSRVWVLASVYEYELPFVKVGQKATMTLAYLPGRAFTGRVSLVYPVLDGATRTVQARIEFANPHLELKPEMYADVEILSDLGERLTVPESAVLSSGTRDIVFVDRGEGYFDPRIVKVGLRLPEAVEILEGLSAGESVVTSANFLVDSESKLKSALEAASAPSTQPTPTPTAPAHRH
ncbi:MAG TPA: efflux RND transporter periplasmic adaptor subunit [Candidatus Polarisedimenticolia bacterium]|jgi:multidrug efflux pump subunit AcrA (membrane-fusion protein)|nr:efflux RND transporter periplasmic adaptor subunit [Candidatus Polarisedimenticolia bacterium]